MHPAIHQASLQASGQQGVISYLLQAAPRHASPLRRFQSVHQEALPRLQARHWRQARPHREGECGCGNGCQGGGRGGGEGEGERDPNEVDVDCGIVARWQDAPSSAPRAK